MIYPPRIFGTLPATRSFKLQRPSHVQAEETVSDSYAVAPVHHAHRPRARDFMTRNFAAQLLDIGLRYGMEDLIPHREEKTGPSFTDDALRNYEEAEENFTGINTAFYTRFAA
jgi:hypothetical protein